LQQVPCTFSFDLNTGKVHLSGEFPNNLPPNLEFGVEYFKQFDAIGVENILFYSDQASDNAGYVIAMQLVAASEGRTQVAHSPCEAPPAWAALRRPLRPSMVRAEVRAPRLEPPF
jgi:hypothetical protein